MNVKILIVQSNPRWNSLLKSAIYGKMPEIFTGRKILFTDSFDHAVDIELAPGALVVCSDQFHDKFSDHRNVVSLKLHDDLKNGNELAKLVKGKFPDASVHVFSEYSPQGITHIDGYIAKERGKDFEGIEKVVQLVKNFSSS